MKHSILPPHGGCGLINRIVPELERNNLMKEAEQYPVYRISDADLSVFYRMADGALSPLEGPMDQDEFNQVLDEEVIERKGDKYAWSIPLAFPIDKSEAEKLDKGTTVAVENQQGELIGTLEISDIYPFDKKKYNETVYGTNRNDHPGARIFNDDPRDYLLGGKIWTLPQPKNPDFGQYMLTPLE